MGSDANDSWMRLFKELVEPPPPDELRRKNEAYARLLVKLNLITDAQAREALELQAAQGGPVRLEDLLIGRGFLTRDQLARSLVARVADDPANRFGRFLRVSPLAPDPLGEAWKAWDSEGRWARLVILAPEHRPVAAASRAAAAIDHPGFARLLESGEANGSAYVAHEFVEGQTLSTHPRHDPLRLVRAVRDAALALTEAHARGVVHGGLGPSTILIDLAGGARILGLGLGAGGTPQSDAASLASTLRDLTPDLRLPESVTSARELAAALTRLLLKS